MTSMRLMALVAAALALAGCGGGGAPVSAGVEVPAAVQAMMAAEFPADGEIHVQSRGKIVIEPETPTCYFENGFIVEPQSLFDALGQVKSLSTGASRLQPATRDSQCEFQADTVLIWGRESANRNGEPYKLVLAVWQGDPAKDGAVWVGGVERSRETYLPCKSCFGEFVNGEFRGTDEEEPVRSSKRQDVAMLGNSFVNHIAPSALRIGEVKP